MSKIVYLEGSTFRGRIRGAKHYYGALCQGDKRIPLKRQLTLEQAAHLNRVYRGTYKAGDTYEGFEAWDELCAVAVSCYRMWFPGAAILISGFQRAREPQRIIDGPSALLARSVQLVEAAQKNGYWLHDSLRMSHICDAWDHVLATVEAGL